MQKIKTLLQQNKKNIYLGLVLGFVFAVGALTPNVSNAMLGISFSGIVTSIFKIIFYIFNFIGGIFFALAAGLVSFALQINMTVANPVENTAADIGWRISRDIANLGFVLLTVIMAFTTIIRVQSYGAKKLLLNLIIAAVVVNFSFLIAGTLIDFSNTLTYFFIGRISPGGLGTGFTEVLANAFGPQKFMLEESDDPIPPDPSQEESGAVTFGVALLSSIAGLFFSVLFTFLAAFVLLMLAAMFMIRYVALTFILILAPLAWLFWVFPALKSYNGRWWSAFWKYTFFAPAASFFVYLSLVAAENLGSGKYNDKISMIGSGLPGVLSKVVQQGTQMIVVAGLMIGAITVAQKMGIEGAGLASKAKDGLMKGAKDYAKTRASNFGTRLSQNKFVGGAMSRFGLSGKNLKGTGEDIQKQREEAKAKHLEYKDQIAAIKNNKELKPEERKAQIKALEDAQDLKAKNYKDQIAAIKKDGTLSKKDREEAIKKLEGEGPDRLGLGKRIGLFAKNATLGKAKRGLGSAMENTGKAVDEQAQKKIDKDGYYKKLYDGAKGGVFPKSDKKDEKKTAAELEKDLEKKLKEKQAMLSLRGPNGLPRFKDSDLKKINKEIAFATQDVATAHRNEVWNMSKEEVEKMHTAALKQRSKAKTKDEETIADKKLEATRQAIRAKSGRFETSDQYAEAIKKEKGRRDEAFVSGVDTAPYDKTISEYENKMNSLLNRASNRLEIFNKMDEKFSKLDKERDEKLKELAQKTKQSAADIKNSNEFKQIENNVSTAKTHIKAVESAVTSRAQKLGELEKKFNELNKVRQETENISESELSGWGITEGERGELIKQLDKSILETRDAVDKKLERKLEKKTGQAKPSILSHASESDFRQAKNDAEKQNNKNWR